MAEPLPGRRSLHFRVLRAQCFRLRLFAFADEVRSFVGLVTVGTGGFGVLIVARLRIASIDMEGIRGIDSFPSRADVWIEPKHTMHSKLAPLCKSALIPVGSPDQTR